MLEAQTESMIISQFGQHIHRRSYLNSSDLEWLLAWVKSAHLQWIIICVLRLRSEPRRYQAITEQVDMMPPTQMIIPKDFYSMGQPVFQLQPPYP
jgi:hypothetical protein